MTDDSDTGRLREGSGDPAPASQQPRTLDGKTVAEAHPELFHYTSVRALGGMLEHNTLWATRATHLNDSTEMLRLWPHLERALVDEYSAIIAEHICRSPAKRAAACDMGGPPRIATHDVAMYVSSMRELLHGAGSFPGVAPPFVTSFTTHSTDTPTDRYRRRHGMLSQWRAYAGDDGVAVVFDPARLARLISLEIDRHYYWPVSFADVIYDDEPDLPSRMTDLLLGVPDFARRLITGHDNSALNLIDPKFAQTVAVSAAHMKHHAFREEGECRIVMAATPSAMRDGMVERGAKIDRPFKTVHHRSGRSGSVPYIKLFEDLGERLPITRVIVGPSRSQLAVLEEVRNFAQKYGLDPEAVHPSEIPYVGSA